MSGRDWKSFTCRLPVTGVVFAKREFWLVPLLVLLTAIGAWLRLPLPGTPVPITMQTFFVLVAGGVGGALAGPLSQSLYLALGMCGVPFFAALVPGGSFPSSVTLGYLVGFIVASGFMGIGHRRRSGLWSWIGRGTVATAIISACGVSWIMMYSAGDFRSALVIGVISFLLFDLTRVFPASLVTVTLNERRREEPAGN